jgi:Flp pilus assembly protein TadG
VTPVSGRRLGERGTALAEFAIASTFALVLMFGILDLGRSLYTYHLVANAARIGSRWALVRGSDCNTAGCTATQATIQTYVQSQSPGVDPALLTVTATYALVPSVCSTAKAAGCTVTVTAAYPFNFVAFPIAQINMSSASQMTISQ